MDAQRLENVLAEIGKQILEHGFGAVGNLGQWGCTSISVELCEENIAPVLAAGACRGGICQGAPGGLSNLAGTIDHTLLKPDATVDQVDTICQEALEHNFASVCVNGTWVRRCAEILKGSGVTTCAVIGFPLGAMAPEVKIYEARRVVEDGACEVDMVMNIGALKSGDDAFVRRDIAGVAEVCHRLGAKLKVILETCLLSKDEIVRASALAKEAGADFVKTSTGFSSGGATIEDVELMRQTVGPVLGVKASGGVRDAEGVRDMIKAGATRIGASASVAIVSGGSGGSGY